MIHVTRRAALAFAAVLLPATLVPAQAQGFNPLAALFGGWAPPARYAPAYAPHHARPDPAYSPQRARAARELRRLQEKRTRFARLPAAADVPDAGKPKKVERGAILDTPGALKAVMNDPTLRPGDIVVFPDGPKVFTGATKAPHRVASFENVAESGRVSRQTLALLSARGAVAAPARTARVALRAPSAKAAPAAAREERAGPRVVYQGMPATR